MRACVCVYERQRDRQFKSVGNQFEFFLARGAQFVTFDPSNF